MDQRIIEAGARLPERGMLTGWAALRLAGAAWFDGRRGGEVPVLLPHGSRIIAPGVQVTRTRRPLPPSVEIHGIAVADPAHALAHHLHREVVFREGVVAAEMAMAAGVVDRRAVRRALGSVWRVHTRSFEMVAMATGECRSAPEARMALVWQIDAGLPRPLMNREILDLDGNRVAVVDLLADGLPVFGEYDGEDHRSRARHRADVRRQESLLALGLVGFTVVAGDRPREQAARMVAACQRAVDADLPESERPWRVGRHVPLPPLRG